MITFEDRSSSFDISIVVVSVRNGNLSDDRTVCDLRGGVDVLMRVSIAVKGSGRRQSDLWVSCEGPCVPMSLIGQEVRRGPSCPSYHVLQRKKRDGEASALLRLFAMALSRQRDSNVFSLLQFCPFDLPSALEGRRDFPLVRRNPLEFRGQFFGVDLQVNTRG